MSLSSDDFDRLVAAVQGPLLAELRLVRQHVASLSSELKAAKRKGSARAWSVGEVAAMLGHTSTWVTERYARILPGALAKAAAATVHEPATLETDRIAQVLEMIGRARRDSNPRLSDSKSADTVGAAQGYESNGRFVADSAQEVLSAALEGRAVPDALLLQLAHAVLLGPAVELAVRVFEGGGVELAAGLQLAALLRSQAAGRAVER